MNNLMLVLTGKRPLKDVWHYLLGNYRYWLYYKHKIWNGYTDSSCSVKNYDYKKHFLMRAHIKEQIDYRIRWMDQECYWAGYCRMCGCQTTALQMADKSCDKPCYPPMMDKDQWDLFNIHRQISFDKGETIWVKDWRTGKPKLYKRKGEEYVHIN